MALVETDVSPAPGLPAWAKAGVGLGLAAGIELALARGGRGDVSGRGVRRGAT